MSQISHRYSAVDPDADNRPASCYLLTYRGVEYWHCYGITMEKWLERKEERMMNII